MSTDADKVAGAFLEEPVYVKVSLKKEYLTFFHRIGILPKVKVFAVTPPTLGTLMRISKVVENIGLFDGNELQKPGGIVQLGFKSIANDMSKVIYVLACIISNRRKSPSKKLIRFLTWSFDPEDMKKLLTLFFQKMDVMGFITSIISMKGMSLIQTGEIIAPDKTALGDLKEELLNTSGLAGTKSDGE
jgi:hypothetical protein